MWKCHAFVAVLLALTARGSALDITIDGDLSNSTQFCVGENITLFCSGGSGSYVWIVPSLSISLSTTFSQVVNSESTFGFTARRLSFIRSFLNVIAFDRLNDTNISCVDGGNEDILSSAIVGIFGVPSRPMVHVNLKGVTSLNLTISKPRESAECVQNYITTVTSTSFTGPLDVSMANAFDSTPAFDTITNLSMCKHNYTVNVVAVDLTGNRSQPFVSMPRITLKDIFVSKERNSTVQPNGDVSISFEIAISDCHTSTLEFFFINLNSKESRSMKRGINESSLVNFTQWISDTQYICVINLVLPSNHRVEVDSFNCSTNVSTVTISPTVLTTSRPLSSSLSIGAIIGIAVVATVAVGVFIFIFLGCVLLCKEAKNRKEPIGRKGNVEELDSKIADNVSHSSSKDGSVPEDQTPTYQAPETIQRQAAGPTGELYTLVATKGKGSKKAKKEEELPVYSVVDKNKKNEKDKLVYTLIDVQNLIPPGITLPYVIEPVVYSTLQ